MVACPAWELGSPGPALPLPCLLPTGLPRNVFGPAAAPFMRPRGGAWERRCSASPPSWRSWCVGRRQARASQEAGRGWPGGGGSQRCVHSPPTPGTLTSAARPCSSPARPCPAWQVNGIAAKSPLPLTVKIRLGESAAKINVEEVVGLLQAAGAAAVTVHGRCALPGCFPWEWPAAMAGCGCGGGQARAAACAGRACRVDWPHTLCVLWSRCAAGPWSSGTSVPPRGTSLSGWRACTACRWWATATC